MGAHEKSGGSHVKREAEAPAAKLRRRTKEEEARPRTRKTGAEAPAGRRSEAEARVKRPAAAVKRQKAALEREETQPAPKRRTAKRRRKAGKTVRNLLILLASLVLALLCGALYAGSVVSGSAENLTGVYLDGIDVGGLTKDQTETRLLTLGWDREGATPLTVQLPAGVSFELDRVAAGAAMPLSAAVDRAYAYGHSGNWIRDLWSWLSASITPVDLGDFTKNLDTAYIRERVKEGMKSFAEMTAGSEGYEIDRENEVLCIVKGAGHLSLDESKLSAAVEQALLGDETWIAYTTVENPPAAPDFQAIWQELKREPQDAYFVEGGWDVVDEIVGCDFDVQQALELWNAANWMETVKIPLDISYPAVTGESLRSLLFRDKLGEQTSYFPNSVANRISNIQLAASKLDGVVLNPGEIFSYNETIGQRTTDAGFLMAAAYSNGEVVEELGGGICQVSSTLYCAVLYSQLGIKSRDNHYFKVDYLPWGMDATVSWPQPDFKFQNTRNYPIRIHAVADPVERYITIEIWGTDEDGTHIELTYDRYRITDETYTDTIIGWNVYLYAHIYDADGNELRVENRAPSTYYLHEEDIQGPHEPRNAEG